MSSFLALPLGSQLLQLSREFVFLTPRLRGAVNNGVEAPLENVTLLRFNVIFTLGGYHNPHTLKCHIHLDQYEPICIFLN